MASEDWSSPFVTQACSTLYDGYQRTMRVSYQKRVISYQGPAVRCGETATQESRVGQGNSNGGLTTERAFEVMFFVGLLFHGGRRMDS